MDACMLRGRLAQRLVKSAGTQARLSGDRSKPRVFHPDADDDGPFSRSVGAAAMRSDGDYFVDDVERTCADQLGEFIGGTIRDVLISIHLDASGVADLVSDFSYNPRGFMSCKGLIKQWITSLVSRAARWLFRLLGRLDGWVSQMVG